MKLTAVPEYTYKVTHSRFSDNIYTPGAQNITTTVSMRHYGEMRRDHLNLCYELINCAVPENSADVVSGWPSICVFHRNQLFLPRVVLS